MTIKTKLNFYKIEIYKTLQKDILQPLVYKINQRNELNATLGIIIRVARNLSHGVVVVQPR